MIAKHLRIFGSLSEALRGNRPVNSTEGSFGALPRRRYKLPSEVESSTPTGATHSVYFLADILGKLLLPMPSAEIAIGGHRRVDGVELVCCQLTPGRFEGAIC
jgi:hypothetical protein